VVPELGRAAPYGMVGLPGGVLGGKGLARGAGGGPLPVSYALTYDLSDFRRDTGKLVSLHQAHPLH
jgi:hypothetical protein